MGIFHSYGTVYQRLIFQKNVEFAPSWAPSIPQQRHFRRAKAVFHQSAPRVRLDARGWTTMGSLELAYDAFQ